MRTTQDKTLCPVCGYDLGFPAWEGGSSSDEICPSCGIQFGYDDAAGGSQEARRQVWHTWRDSWIKKGMEWFSKGRAKPIGWDPTIQLKQLDAQ